LYSVLLLQVREFLCHGWPWQQVGQGHHWQSKYCSAATGALHHWVCFYCLLWLNQQYLRAPESGQQSLHWQALIASCPAKQRNWSEHVIVIFLASYGMWVFILRLDHFFSGDA
jgi:hypothetical protein